MYNARYIHKNNDKFTSEDIVNEVKKIKVELDILQASYQNPDSDRLDKNMAITVNPLNSDIIISETPINLDSEIEKLFSLNQSQITKIFSVSEMIDKILNKNDKPKELDPEQLNKYNQLQNKQLELKILQFRSVRAKNHASELSRKVYDNNSNDFNFRQPLDKDINKS